MKKFIITTLIIAGALPAVSQSLQYFMQRSSTNIAAISEISSLQAFLSAGQSFQGFEGAPKNILLNVASPLPEFGNSANRNSSRGNRNSVEPVRNFVNGTVMHETFGVHSILQVLAGYNYRMTVGDVSSVTFGIGGGIKSICRDYSKWEPEAGVHDYKETKFSMQAGIRYEADRFGISAFMNDNDFFGEITWGRLWDGGGSSGTNDYWGDSDEKNWHGQIALLGRHSTEFGTNSLRISAQAVYRDGLGIGASYETGNDLSVNVSLRFTKYLRIGYAYQLMALNPMAKKNEIVVRYRFVRNDQR